MSKFVIGIQARSRSTRCPGKSLMDLCGRPIWRWVYDTAKRTGFKVYMLIPYADMDLPMYNSVRARNVPHICGSLEKPLERYLTLIDSEHADYVVRLTGDCPLVNVFVLQDMITQCDKNQYPYLQHEQDGMDVQIIHTTVLHDFPHDEHVVDIKQIKINNKYLPYEMHLSIDTIEQFQHIQEIVGATSNFGS